MTNGAQQSSSAAKKRIAHWLKTGSDFDSSTPVAAVERQPPDS
jgi:hypothetical protein